MFRVYGDGSRLKLEIHGILKFWGQGRGIRVKDLRCKFRERGLGLRVQGPKIMAQEFGLRV